MAPDRLSLTDCPLFTRKNGGSTNVEQRVVSFRRLTQFLLIICLMSWAIFLSCVEKNNLEGSFSAVGQCLIKA